MNTPYRDRQQAADEEPIPNLAVHLRLWLVAWIVGASIGGVALAATRDDIDKARLLLVMGVPAVVFHVLLAALYRPFGVWLAARHERIVAEGVAALEAKVSARK